MWVVDKPRRCATILVNILSLGNFPLPLFPLRGLQISRVPSRHAHGAPDPLTVVVARICEASHCLWGALSAKRVFSQVGLSHLGGFPLVRCVKSLAKVTAHWGKGSPT